MRGQRRQHRIPNSEAQRRLCAIVPFLRDDIELAIAIEATLKKGNEILTALSESERAKWGARCYDLVAQSLVLQLAVILARLFDSGAKWRHPNKKDIASIQLMHRLLKQARCRKYLMTRHHNWFSDAPTKAERFPERCSSAIDDALSTYRLGMTDPKVRRALKGLRYFRDKRLAHSILDADDDARPTYAQLFLLTDMARNILKPAIYAAEATQYNFTAIEVFWAGEAGRFWRRALSTRVHSG